MESLHELFGDCDRPAAAGNKNRDGKKSKKFPHRRRPSKELMASNMASMMMLRHCSPVPNSGSNEELSKRYEAGYLNESSAAATETTTASLPPEPALGNIEYKLKLVSPTRQRFEHLVTQVSDHTYVHHQELVTVLLFYVKQYS
jgi:hypothetical protein